MPWLPGGPKANVSASFSSYLYYVHQNMCGLVQPAITLVFGKVNVPSAGSGK